jgi:hypothetical protein
VIDYLDRDALLALDIDPADAGELIAASPLTGHGGRPVVEAEALADLIVLIDSEGC